MFDLPEQFCDLSTKRQRILAEMRQKERQDAALNCVVIGIKALNQVHHLGLQRLSELSKTWGTAISGSYNAGIALVDGWDSTGFPGDLVTDPLEAFADLSGRRLRQITEYLARNRQEAHGNAYQIGMRVIRSVCGYGDLRADRLESQWLTDIRYFYDDREVNEPALTKWINDIGFIFEGGRLQSYMDGDGKPIRKATAERRMKDAETKI